MVSDNEPRVGEKHDQGQGQGDQAENMKKAGRRIRRSAAITESLIISLCSSMSVTQLLLTRAAAMPTTQLW